MIRSLQPELLDALPPDHPDAQHSRRDLRIINWIAGNHRWIGRTLPPLLAPSERTLEIGAGLGELSRRLAARGLVSSGLDLCPRPPHWPAESNWHVTDVRTFAGFADYAVIVGNLIFHQFSDAELGELGNKLRGTARVIVACEPARRRASQALLRVFAPMWGASPVTRHDAHVSVAAGFRDDELPRLLGLMDSNWKISRTTTALGSYRMTAVRRP